jgi:hypothetical protein
MREEMPRKMRNCGLGWITGLAALVLLSGTALAVSQKYRDASKARIENGYAVVLLADGSKTVVPVASLNEEDRDFLTKLSLESPLPRGKSVVKIVKEEVKAKPTIVVSSTVGPLETVQLVPPNVPRDQIGATCMVYARVHWLDIAGYYVDNVDIYKIINNADTDHPWKSPNFYRSMDYLVMNFKPQPIVHNWSPKIDAFEWTRQELRKGRPVLAAFPREIWQDLPPGFVGKHPWNGGNVGHQIVINGFTWNRETHEGTFHIINSWKELPEFDLKTDAAKGAMEVEQSLSPKGEPREAAAVAQVTKVTLIKTLGKINLYEVDTSDGVERVAAPDPATAKAMAEGTDSTY